MVEFLNLYWHIILTALAFLGASIFMIGRYIKLYNGNYEIIWSAWIIPLGALPMLDGIVTMETCLWLGILEICLGVAGATSLLVHELKGIKIASNW